MNNEQQNNDERFSLVKRLNGGWAIYDNEVPGDDGEVCIYWDHKHPHALKSAAAERDQLNAWNRDGENIRPVEYVTTPRRSPNAVGTFSKAALLTLTFEEKRRYLAEIFRSPNFSDCDKFKALQEDNRMLAMFSLKNGNDPEN